MSIGVLVNCVNQFESYESKYWAIGRNTGNILFMHALVQMLDCEPVNFWEREKLNRLDVVVTTELIWIQQNVQPSADLADLVASHKRVVPLSVGLQAARASNDFALHPDMVSLLKEIGAHAPIAARGQFTADTLRRHGIENVHIIGCPSVYQLPLFQDSIDFLRADVTPSFVTANYKSFYGMTTRDFEIISYIADNCHGFAEQTEATLQDAGYEYRRVTDWFDRHSHLFFDLESWVRHNRRYDFSLGMRFHGNVAALLAGVKALFVTIDSRTTEMTDHFRLPALPFDQFSTSTSIEEYAAMVDYGRFIESYPDRLAEFRNFIDLAGLRFSPAYQEKLAQFRF